MLACRLFRYLLVFVSSHNCRIFLKTLEFQMNKAFFLQIIEKIMLRLRRNKHAWPFMDAVRRDEVETHYNFYIYFHSSIAAVANKYQPIKLTTDLI